MLTTCQTSRKQPPKPAERSTNAHWTNPPGDCDRNKNRCDDWETRIMRQPWACRVMMKRERDLRQPAEQPTVHPAAALSLCCPTIQYALLVSNTSIATRWQARRHTVRTRKPIAFHRFRDKRRAAAWSLQQGTIELIHVFSPVHSKYLFCIPVGERQNPSMLKKCKMLRKIY